MKNKTSWLSARIALLLGTLATLLAGCNTAPTPFDRKFYDIQTNTIPHVVFVTNVVPLTVSDTLLQGGLPLATQTNTATLVTWQTNTMVITNFVAAYSYIPNTNAAQLTSTVSRTAGLFGPFGELAGILLGGIIAGYGIFRSSRASKTAAVLAQVIETGRQVLQATPQGQLLDQQWKLWMMQHQAEQGVMLEVIRLLQNVVDEPSAKLAAQRLAQIITERTHTQKG